LLSLSPPPTNAPPLAVIVTKDLFFGSQVTGTAATRGWPVAMAMTVDALRDHLVKGSVRGVILDLAGEIAPAEIIAALPPKSRPKTLAFGPHVHTGNLQAAREAGFDQVMPRSKFSAELMALLEWITR
jgi:hypothetical protein